MPGGNAAMGMWSEARRQEKMIRGAMVDYRKRAERRSQYYERIKQDPAQFLRVHGTKIRMKLDTVEAERAEGYSVMQAWQGDPTVSIDRFDARTFLDSVPDVGKRESSSDSSSSSDSDSDSGKPGAMGKTALLKDSKVKQRCNYERYRTLIQNDYLGVEELACLKQIYLEEEMGGGANSASGGGGATGTGDKLGKGASNSATPKAAIGYNYEKNAGIILGKHSFSTGNYSDESSDSDSDDSFDEIELEVTLDIDKLDAEQRKLLTTYSLAYGLRKDIFLRYLGRDKNEQESIRLSKMLEDEKALYSGRKGRHKRREFHDEKAQLHRQMNPKMELSYISKDRKEATESEHGKSEERKKSRSSSKSSSEEESAPKYITSFDFNNENEEDEQDYKETKKSVNKSAKKSSSSVHRKSKSKERSPRSRKRERAKSRSRSRRNSSRRSPKSFRSKSRSRSRRSLSRKRSGNSRKRSRSRSSRNKRDRRSRSRDRLGKNERRRRSSRSRSRSKGRNDNRIRKSSPVSKYKSNASSKSSARRRSQSSSDSDASADKNNHNKVDLSAIKRKNDVSRSLGVPGSSTSNGNGVIKRYRRKSLSSTSELEDSPPRNAPIFSKPPLPPIRKSFETSQVNTSSSNIDTIKSKSSNNIGGNSDKKSAVERMKKLMERQLNKQIKADKQSRALKEEKKFQERMDWEEHQKHMSTMWASSSRRKDRDRSRSSSRSSSSRMRRRELREKSGSKNASSSDSD